MLRLVAAFLLFIALSAPGRADTSVIISGGGFSFFSGSGGLQHFHRGGHWRKAHKLDKGFHFHRLRRHERLLLPSPHHRSWIGRHEPGSWHHGHKRHWKKQARPQIVIVVPGPFDSRIKIVTVPGQLGFGTFLDRRTGHHRLVLLPPLKPGRLAFAD
jgi:hypothetical protein